MMLLSHPRSLPEAAPAVALGAAAPACSASIVGARLSISACMASSRLAMAAASRSCRAMISCSMSSMLPFAAALPAATATPDGVPDIVVPGEDCLGEQIDLTSNPRRAITTRRSRGTVSTGGSSTSSPNSASSSTPPGSPSGAPLTRTSCARSSLRALTWPTRSRRRS